MVNISPIRHSISAAGAQQAVVRNVVRIGELGLRMQAECLLSTHKALGSIPSI